MSEKAIQTAEMEKEIARHPTRYIRAPWLRQRTYFIRKKKYRVEVYDQPGRWMNDDALARLTETLREIAARSMDALPDYGVFSTERRAFANRVVGVVYVSRTEEPVAFTAMVYLPILLHGRIEPVLHLGLTMIQKRFRGQRIQGPLFEKLVYPAFFNQLTRGFLLTNIAASPAGIGSVSDYFDDAFPHYGGRTARRAYHLQVAEKVLAHYRHEFGCAESAEFDPETFVVRGSNDPAAGGAWQFIREDPVSRYRRDECNEFCRHHLRFQEGDELFQVAQVDLVRGTLGVLRRMGTRKRAAQRAEAAGAPAMGGK